VKFSAQNYGSQQNHREYRWTCGRFGSKPDFPARPASRPLNSRERTIILVLRSYDGGWPATVYDGHIPLPESGFQAALDDIVARLRPHLCLYSAIPPMTPEGMRNHVRTMPPAHPERDRQWRYWKDKGVTAVAPMFEINTDFFKTGQ
jgi:hypothetical protein